MSRRANEAMAAVFGVAGAMCGIRLFRNPLFSFETSLLLLGCLLGTVLAVFFLNRSASGK
jgi:hypothetical protein